MPREVIDPGPFRFTEIHGPHRSREQQFHVGRPLRQRGLQPARCEFKLEDVPLIDLIESLIVEAHLERGLQEIWDYQAWRAQGAPATQLRAIFADIDERRRRETLKFTPRLNELESLYARGVAVEPLVAKQRGDFALVIGRQGADRPGRAASHIRGSASPHRPPAGVRAAQSRRRVFLLAPARDPRYCAGQTRRGNVADATNWTRSG